MRVSKALAAARRDLDPTAEAGLAAYLEFQRALFDMHEGARDQITATLELVDRPALKARLSQGLPLLSFAQLPIEAEWFAGLGVAMAQVLMRYYPDLEGQRLPITATDWIALAERRFAQNQAIPEPGHAEPSDQIHSPELVAGSDQGLVEEASVSSRLAQTAGDLALRPYLVWAGEQVLSHVDQEAWKRAYCPVCGGTPDFALLDEDTGARHLACSRCNSQWRYQRVGCPFCETPDYNQIVYYPSDDELYRLYVCKACRRYLKTLDLRKTSASSAGPAGGRPVLLEIERINTVTLDILALQEGYR